VAKRDLEQISVRIERDDLKCVRHIAVDEDVSPSQIIREAVRAYLERRKSGGLVNSVEDKLLVGCE